MQAFDEVLKGLTRRPSYENEYFRSLFDMCRQGGLVEGVNAVNFFKLSGLTN